MKQDISFTGIKVLNDAEKTKLRSIINKELMKLDHIEGDLKLQVYVKTFDTGGRRKRYVLHMKAITPYGMVVLDPSEKGETKRADWNIAEATHKAMAFLDKEIKKTVNPEAHGWREKFLRSFRRS